MIGCVLTCQTISFRTRRGWTVRRRNLLDTCVISPARFADSNYARMLIRCSASYIRCLERVLTTDVSPIVWCSFVPVPETVLKRRKARDELKAAALAQRKTEKTAAKTRRAGMLKRAEEYVKEYRTAERSTIEAKRAARAAGDFYVEPQAKLAFVVRIRGINGVSPKVRKVLQLLRLRQINNAAFVKLNKATLQMLQMVKPYIAWGYPNLKSVRELVYKRGFGKVNKQRLALTDNSLIEDALGAHGIVCVEDLIHEIFTVGAHFKEANNFLWPFKLNSARGEYPRLVGWPG